MNPYDMPPIRIGQAEPSAAARTLARMMRDTFNALALEGFSEPQALHLTGVLFAANIRRGDTPS